MVRRRSFTSTVWDGHVSRFVVQGEAEVRELWERVQPGRVFTQAHLLVGGSRSLSIFPSDSIVRVDVVADGFPDWPFPHGVTDIQEISVEEFEQRYRPERDGSMKMVDGAPIVRYGEIELASGQRLFMEVHTRAESRLPVEIGMLLQQILSSHSLFGRRRGGGVVLLNPANVVRLAFYPAPPSPPPNTIIAEPVSASAGSEFVLLLGE